MIVLAVWLVAATAFAAYAAAAALTTPSGGVTSAFGLTVAVAWLALALHDHLHHRRGRHRDHSDH